MKAGTVPEPESAVAEGGPADGRKLGDGSAHAYEVRLVDRTTHVYVRTPRVLGAARVYVYAGRR